MRIILIGNYLPDQQESMIRFTQMLDRGFTMAGIDSEIWWPQVFFGFKARSTNSGIGKWLGYLDKWIIFPMILRWRIFSKIYENPNVRFHICDHSNSPYLRCLPTDRTGITCHDVIAIRGGIGYADSYYSASKLGKVLQKWILHHLGKANLLASVSQLTFHQLKELVPDKAIYGKDWRVINNAFNADFKPMERNGAVKLLLALGIDPDTPFILHVGSGLPRKNRKLLLNMVHALDSRWSGNICFAGEAIDNELVEHAKVLGIQNRIMTIVKPEHNSLVALYSTCEAFIFPSLSEGFGWPVIEAQACGAPVVASNIEPMPEVSGGAALHADPLDPKAFAELFLSLGDNVVRSEIIKSGFENCKRFELTPFINAYLDLHKLKGITRYDFT